jgi:uncharacterized protein YbjT (DUF2867 family)
LPEVPPLSSQPEQDRVVARRESSRWIATVRSSLLDATAADASHYVMLSGIGVENPPDGDDVFSVYLRAKAEADAAVMANGRDWTIVRPGRLTDDPGTGLVRIDSAPFPGEITRYDPCCAPGWRSSSPTRGPPDSLCQRRC